jgi:hypothetical protein
VTNSVSDPDRLYRLLPAVYRESEATRGAFPLRDLLRLVTEQAAIVDADIQQLWDNSFIETCARWAIPYIGELVGNNLLHDADRDAAPDTAHDLFPDLAGRSLRAPIAVRLRADVAKTISYRRRKGTPAMLEELARDVTGWAAHVVAFFQLLEWTQHLNHLRAANTECAELRNSEAIERLDRPFDDTSHLVDVRPIGQSDGWYNIRNVGFFLWRLRAYPALHVQPRAVTGSSWQFHFSPLGNPAPLFAVLRPAGDAAGLSTELDVPGPIRPAAFHADLERHATKPPPEFTDFYGAPELHAGCSFVIVRGGAPVPVDKLHCRNLDIWAQPSGTRADEVWIDVVRGRIAFGAAWPADSVEVSYHYGFSADLGGGSYERAKWLLRRDAGTRVYQVGPGFYATLQLALQAWASDGRPNAVITILDSRTYGEPLAIDLADDRWLAIEADNGQRPLVIPQGGMIVVSGVHPGSELTLNGLLVEGGIEVSGDLARLRLLHTTLVPGPPLAAADGRATTTGPSVIAHGEYHDGGGKLQTGNAKLKVQLAFSIVGPLHVTPHADSMTLLDCIVDGVRTDPKSDRVRAIQAPAPTADSPESDVDPALPWGPPTQLERCTIFGPSLVKQLPLASDTVWTEAVQVEEHQVGCVRFCYTPPGSSLPRRYRCQPDLEIAAQVERAEQAAQAQGLTLSDNDKKKLTETVKSGVRGWLVPTFTALQYGRPGYAQLRLGVVNQIRTGAEDGSEMGAFSHLKQPQRETNLRIRLGEYLPFGLDAGVVYVT